MTMGAWGVLAFDNDTANDWAYGLEDVADLSLVESAFDELVDVGDHYVELDIAWGEKEAKRHALQTKPLPTG
jgi:Domain of unknown function (DUF4259)